MSTFGTVGIAAATSNNVTSRESERSEGVVVCYNGAKGYGFIGRSDGREDVVLGKQQLQKSGITHIIAGQQVSFSIKETARTHSGFEAAGIQLLGEVKKPIQPPSDVEWAMGTMVFYEPRRGFGGLIIRGQRVMLHANVIEKSGIVCMAKGMEFEAVLDNTRIRSFDSDALFVRVPHRNNVAHDKQLVEYPPPQ